MDGEDLCDDVGGAEEAPREKTMMEKMVSRRDRLRDDLTKTETAIRLLEEKPDLEPTFALFKQATRY